MTSTASRRVLFFAPFGSYLVHHQLDAVVATALKLRGATVQIARCDGVFKTCDLFAWSANPAQTCADCAATGAEFIKTFGLPSVQLRAYLSEADFSTAQQWADELKPEQYTTARFGDVPIGDWSTSSLFSYFRMTEGALSEPSMQPKAVPIHKGFLVTGLLTYLGLTKLYDEFRPTHLFCFNARFAPYRVAFETARARGISVVTHERGNADDSFLLYENYGAIQTQPIYDAYRLWRDVPLTNTELVRVKEYLTNREKGVDINVAPFVDYATEHTKVRRFLRVPADAKLIGLFTSSEYELSWSQDFRAFTTQLELVRKLIDVFRNRSEYLVIRHHPYLGGDPNSLADHGFMTQAYKLAKSAPPNVRFIMPGEKLSSYALFWNLDASIGLFSTTGVESAARGVGNASFKQSIFRDAANATIESDQPGYLNALIDNLMAETVRYSTDNLRTVYRFINVFMNRISVKFQTFGIKNFYEHDFRIDQFPLIAQGGDASLDRVCAHVLEGKPLIEQPPKEIDESSRVLESQFLDAEVGEISTWRRTIREQSRQYVQQTQDVQVGVYVFSADGVSQDAVLRDEGSASRAAAQDWDRSRHRLFTVHHLNLDSTNVNRHVAAAPNSGSLMDALQRDSAEYVVLTDARVRHDEAFLSLGVDQLHSPGNKTKHGVLFGAWLTDDRGVICGQVFSKRTPCREVREFLALTAFVNDPYLLLSLMLIRKSALLDFLTRHQTARTVDLNCALHRWSQSADWIQIQTQGARVYSATSIGDDR